MTATEKSRSCSRNSSPRQTLTKVQATVGNWQSFQVPDGGTRHAPQDILWVFCDRLATPMSLPSGASVRPHLGQNATALPGDRETLDTRPLDVGAV